MTWNRKIGDLKLVIWLVTSPKNWWLEWTVRLTKTQKALWWWMETYLIHPTGVLQGDVLAPLLLVMLVDYLLKKATSQLDSGAATHPCRSRRHPAKSLNDLDFADDIALLESSISQAQAQLSKTAEAAAADLGLVISAPKTKYVTVYCNPQPALQVYGDPINHVSDIRYLGCMVAYGSS